MVKNGKVSNFLGDLDEYRSSLSNDKKNKENSKNKNNNDRKKIRNLENKIKRLTEEKKDLEKKLSANENISDYEKLNFLSEEYDNINNQIESLEDSWLLETEYIRFLILKLMAEGTGFEPAVPLRILLFSRQTLSTTQPPLQKTKTDNFYYIRKLF